MLLYSFFEFKLTRIFLLEQHTGVMFSGTRLFLRHKQWFQWKIPLEIVCHSSFELMGFLSPVNEKRFDTIKDTAFRKWFKFTIGLFQRAVISMQNNFNSLQKQNQMSEQKCLAVFLTDTKWSLTQRVQIFCQPLI